MTITTVLAEGRLEQETKARNKTISHFSIVLRVEWAELDFRPALIRPRDLALATEG
jgi:hypothetical protein